MGTQIFSFGQAIPRGTIAESYQEEEMDPGQTFGVGASFHSRARESMTEFDNPFQTVVDDVLKRLRDVPDDVMKAMPENGASQHDHYIYGWSKKRA